MPQSFTEQLKSRDSCAKLNLFSKIILFSFITRPVCCWHLKQIFNACAQCEIQTVTRLRCYNKGALFVVFSRSKKRTTVMYPSLIHMRQDVKRSFWKK